jgi:ATP-dependent DNA helicase Q1
VTLAALADLVRGLGGGSFGVVQQGKGRKRKLGEEKGRVDVVDVAGGKVELNKDVSG